MNGWYSASELAGLSGLPKRPHEVSRIARRERWESRPRRGRGGGKEYASSALPAKTRAALAATMASEAAQAGRHEARKAQLQDTITEEAARNRRLSGLSKSLHQPLNGQRRIDAKLHILSVFEKFHKASGLAIRVARPDFARRYNAGEIEVEASVRIEVPKVSKTTLWEWDRAKNSDGIAALAGGYGNRRGDSIIDRQPQLAEFLVSMLVTYPHTTIANIQQCMRARLKGQADMEFPSARALQRWVGRWKRENKQTFTALTNPDAWKSRYMVAFGSQSADVVRVNQRWELDSTPGDVMLTDGRHVVIGVVDVFSRRARLLVSKTSKAAAIATLLRHTLLDWGAPDQAKTDGGSDYVSKHITRVFAGLEVEHLVCTKFAPWEKPHIESFFRTFSHGLVELLHGFIGHNVAERKAIEARASFADRLMKRGGALEVSMSAADFQQFCDRWCQDVYLHAQHEGLKGKTPFDVLAANRDPIRAVTDPRALDVLLAEGGARTVQKKGIEIDRAWFIAAELEAHVGEDIFYREDQLDLGRIYVFDAGEGFICVAECPERTGMDRREVAIKARQLQKARVQEERAVLKATAKRVGTDDVVREVLLDKAEAVGKLARLPGPSTTHWSGGLAEAARAARGFRAPEPKPMTDDERADLVRLEADLAAQAATARPRDNVVAIDDPRANYRRFLRIGAALEAGHVAAAEDRAWHASYRDTPECRAAQAFAEDFPDEFKERSA